MKRALFVIGSIAAAMAASPEVTGDSLVGVWEVVSETTVLTEPKPATVKRAEPEWEGIWTFQHGWYTRIMAKKNRDTDTFLHPKTLEDYGFDASAGQYEVTRDTLSIGSGYSFYPLGFRPRDFHIDLRGDTLTLTERWAPHVESMSAGTRTIVLRRKL